MTAATSPTETSATPQGDTSPSAPEVRPEIVQEYALRRAFFVDYASVVEAVLRQSLERAPVRFLDVQSRAKTVESFREKASRVADDGVSLKYADPMSQLTDLAACRIIVFFPKTIKQIESLLRTEFDVSEKVDHAANAIEEGRLGYLSVHFLARLKMPRAALPEYARFGGTVVEIQVRTVMQHAWAEIEHDIQYKSSYAVPKELARRFVTLAGLLEVADREFQSIQDRDEELRTEVSASIGAGQFTGVEVTATSLKAYLDRNFGPDGRMSQWSYEFATRIVKALGVMTIEELDEAIHGFDDNEVSQVLEGRRVGQLNRFEHVLLAAFRDAYIQKHLWHHEPWFQLRAGDRLKKLMDAGMVRKPD
jgi:ppGpp synthetase/RelA/SpoT-type nucleotidyltranferase